MLGLLVANKLRIYRAYIFDTKRTAVVRNISTFIVLLVLVWAVFVFFHRFIFSYVASLEDIGFLLIERLVSVGFLLFFFLLILSSFVVSLAMLYRSRETEYLFSTPIPELYLFTDKFIDIVVYSSWAILVMALPILGAYATIRGFGMIDYLFLAVLVILPYVLLAAAAGTVAALCILYASRFLSMKVLVSGVLGLFVMLVYAVMTFVRPNDLVIPFTDDFRGLHLFINNVRLNSHPFTPNFWVVQSLRALVFREPGEFVLYAGSLVTSALLAVSILYVAAERLFVDTWRFSHDRKRAERGRSVIRSGGLLTLAPSSQKQALLAKDLLMFLRNPAQWSQAFLIAALLALYFFNLRLIPADIEIEYWRTIVFAMNFGFCGFVLATLAVRFVFPSISLEGRSFWVLITSPVSIGTMFTAKWLTAVAGFLLVGEAIGIGAALVLSMEPLYRILTMAGIGVMSAALASLAVGFGAAFPDFDQRNPSRIASGVGGIITIITSLLYVAAMLAIVALPSYQYIRHLTVGDAFPMTEIAVAGGLALVINLSMIVAPLVYGRRALLTREL